MASISSLLLYLYMTLLVQKSPWLSTFSPWKSLPYASIAFWMAFAGSVFNLPATALLMPSSLALSATVASAFEK